MKLQLAYKQADTKKTNPLEDIISNAVANLSRVQILTESCREEVQEFLRARPAHTVVMTGFIRDHGLESENNRGRFYAYRGRSGTLEGVALIGHATLVEARSQDALTAFALKARESETPIRLMMSDGDSIESFWRVYSADRIAPRRVCRERLFEIRHPVPVRETVPGLRLAVAQELLPIAAAHAGIALTESGVDPLEKDRAGFLKRVARRIAQNRVWVVFEDGRLIFKADVVAETDEAMYLEGVYVDEESRGRGLGADCLSQLSRILLEKAKHVCLLSNVEFEAAHGAYRKAGFKSHDSCVTIFV
jgi:GNAT superfamily N-acetyltransferase